jgi:organizing structure protein 2
MLLRVRSNIFSNLQPVAEPYLPGRVKSLAVPEEPLTPGILYVGVATLTGSIISRNRLLSTRLFLPPLFFLLTLNHFLPKTSHNLSLYASELEERYAPRVKEKHDIANAHTRMTWEMAKDATRDGRESVGRAMEGLVGRVQDATGLKLRETLGLGEKILEKAEGKTVELKDTLDKKAGLMTDAAERKVEETKRLV